MSDIKHLIVSGKKPHDTYHSVHLTKDPARAILWKVLADYLSSYVPPDAHVIELGAGYCHWINSVRAAKKVAVDVWSDMSQYADADVVPVHHDLSLGLPKFGNNKFDVVLASNLLEHFEPNVASHLIAEIFDCLRSGGCFIIIQPNFRYSYRHYFDDYTHRSIFTDASLSNLIRSHGFYIERVQPAFMPFSLCGGRFPVHPWLIRAYLKSPIKLFAGQMLVIGRKPK